MNRRVYITLILLPKDRDPVFSCTAASRVSSVGVVGSERSDESECYRELSVRINLKYYTTHKFDILKVKEEESTR